MIYAMLFLLKGKYHSITRVIFSCIGNGGLDNFLTSKPYDSTILWNFIFKWFYYK